MGAPKSIILATLLLTSCGGGGTTPTPAPTQAPAPAPAPSPSPTPTPTPVPNDPNPLPVAVGPVFTLANDLAMFGDGMLYAPTLELRMQVTNDVYEAAVGSSTSTDARRDWLLYPEKNRTLVIWTGHNNFHDPDTVLADIAAMNAALPHDHYLVIGLVTKDVPEEWIGGADRAIKDYINAELARRYGNKFINAQNVLTAAANPNNAQDRIDVQHGATPSTMRNPGDGLHLRPESGARVIVNAIRAKIEAEGW